jgi:hypothetical protein
MAQGARGDGSGSGPAAQRSRERLTALVLLVVLVFYGATIGWRGVLLVADGRPAAVLLGVGVILVPIVTLAAVWRLVLFARDGSAMMRAQTSGGEPPERETVWRTALAHAETHRLDGDRGAEQRAYRAAVRAWREAQRTGG